MQNMKDMTEINEALGAISKVNNDLSIDSARSQFDLAKSAVGRRNLEQQALAEFIRKSARKTSGRVRKYDLRR